MRPAQTTIFSGNEFQDVFPALFASLGPLSTYAQRIEAIWTDGKADKLWSTASDSELADAGFLVDASVQSGPAVLTAKIVIDFGIANKPGAASMSSLRNPPAPKAAPNEVRRHCFRYLCHEYIHAIQSWNSASGRKPRYGSVFLSLEHEARRKNIPDPRGYAYNQHPYEHEAFRLSDQAVIRFGSAIDRGEYDYMLPMAWIA